MKAYHKSIFVFLLVESLLLFIGAPKNFNFYFNVFCMMQYLFASYFFVKVQNKKNYFDFDLLFLISYFFTMFFFPVFMYGTDVEKLFFSFQYNYNEEVISRATALSLLGAQAYMLGNLVVRKKRDMICSSQTGTLSFFNIIPHNVLIILSVLFLLLFFKAAGPELFSHKYDGAIGGDAASGALTYILLMFSVLLFSVLIIEYYNRYVCDEYLRKRFPFYLAIFFSVIFLLIGSRTLPLQIVLMIIGIYSTLIRPIDFKKMFLLILGGISVLTIFGILRTQGSGENSGGALLLIQDLVLNNRNTFVALDYVDVNGLSWGRTMIIPIMGVVPFLNSLFFAIFPISPESCASGLVITAISLNKDSDFEVGFGTNIIADIYMSFGVIGVILLMFVLGYIVKRAMLKAVYGYNIYSLILYAILVSNAVFIVRGDYFVFLRPYIWCCIIVNIFKHHPCRLTLKFKNEKKY